MRFRALLLLLIPSVSGQLIPTGQPIPHTGKPPVVFLNGYQTSCSGSSFTGSFGIADQILQANGEASVFFNNCSVSGKPSMEILGAAFASFLAALRYDDGTAVDTVDIVAHSMGGLILRSYLSGKQTTSGQFVPPPVTHIRKALFLATPHFGSPISSVFGIDDQTNEMAGGSHFLFELGTWNQQNDDLRGIDALTAIGNGGTGVLTKTPGFDDGVVALTAASLAFYMPGRTRVVPYCHVPGTELPGIAGLCPASAKGIAVFASADQDTARLMLSFFNGTSDWQSIGTPIEQDRFLSVNGGIIALAEDSNGAAINSSSAAVSGPANKNLSMGNSQVAYTDMFPVGNINVAMTTSAGVQNRAYTLKPAVYQAIAVKSGPNLAGVVPAAAAMSARILAPRMIVSIYGDALAQMIAQPSGQPLPGMLSDVQVMVNGAPLGLLYVSPTQINAVLPDSAAPGLTTLTVQNSVGSQTVNVWFGSAFPVIFTQDQSGSGPASVLNGGNQTPVDSSHPLHAGDYAEIFLTGLGTGNPPPAVTIGGVACPVSFAGPAPGYAGLDQINCVIPQGLTSGNAVLTVQSGGWVSNATTLAVQ